MLSHQSPVLPEPKYRAALNITEDRGGGSGVIPGLRAPALLTLSAGGIKTGGLNILQHPPLSLTIYRAGKTIAIPDKKDIGPTKDLALAILFPSWKARSSGLVINIPPLL